jgi:hypothetical protein
MQVAETTYFNLENGISMLFLRNVGIRQQDHNMNNHCSKGPKTYMTYLIEKAEAG